jgi:hypothetical protein
VRLTVPVFTDATGDRFSVWYSYSVGTSTAGLAGPSAQVCTGSSPPSGLLLTLPSTTANGSTVYVAVAVRDRFGVGTVALATVDFVLAPASTFGASRRLYSSSEVAPGLYADSADAASQRVAHSEVVWGTSEAVHLGTPGAMPQGQASCRHYGRCGAEATGGEGEGEGEGAQSHMWTRIAHLRRLYGGHTNTVGEEQGPTWDDSPTAGHQREHVEGDAVGDAATARRLILGGTLVSAGSYPFLVNIKFKTRDRNGNIVLMKNPNDPNGPMVPSHGICGGSIIASAGRTFILTAAHCMQDNTIPAQDVQPQDITVCVGWLRALHLYPLA